MHDLGVPYVLVDSPGATDNRRDVMETARLVLSMASVLMMVVRRDQLRSHAVDMLAAASEGSLVVPVINNTSILDDAVQTDTEAFVARLRRAAPRSQVTAAVHVPDFEIHGRSESVVGSEAVADIIRALMAELAQGDSLGRTVNRLNAMDSRFRSSLHACLRDELPNLTTAVQRLNHAALALPGEVAASLVGSSPSLRAGIRSRLRAGLISETPAIWFPYRTALGVLSLTSGAWDRVVLSLAGSLPSLISAAYTGVRNLSESVAHSSDVRDGIRKRSSAAVADRLGPLVARFRAEIHRLSGRENPVATNDPFDGQEQRHVQSQLAYLAGIDALQERSQQIVDSTIERESPSRATATCCAVFGTLLFWLLMAGPIVALYRSYIKASASSLKDFAGSLEYFPRPDFSMVLTSVVLSALPLAIFSMLVLSFIQGRRRIDRIEQAIRDEHRSAILELQQQRVLRLEWDDPLLADAEFLLTAGAFDTNTENDFGGRSML